MRKSLFVIFVAAHLIGSGAALGATILVPADQPTIQAAVDAAAIEDLILVSPGTYVENVDFLQKSVTLQSEAGPYITVIDGNHIGAVVTFVGHGTDSAVIDGFTIRNGQGTKGGGREPRDGGGGIACANQADPTILNCRIVDNQATNGGGIRCEQYCSPTIENCTISGNSASAIGGAISCYYECYPAITNCVITNNSALGGGGIMASVYSAPTITHSTISENTAITNGGGILCFFFARSPMYGLSR